MHINALFLITFCNYSYQGCKMMNCKLRHFLSMGLTIKCTAILQFKTFVKKNVVWIFTDFVQHAYLIWGYPPSKCAAMQSPREIITFQSDNFRQNTTSYAVRKLTSTFSLWVDATKSEGWQLYRFKYCDACFAKHASPMLRGNHSNSSYWEIASAQHLLTQWLLRAGDRPHNQIQKNALTTTSDAAYQRFYRGLITFVLIAVSRIPIRKNKNVQSHCD